MAGKPKSADIPFPCGHPRVGRHCPICHKIYAEKWRRARGIKPRPKNMDTRGRYQYKPSQLLATDDYPVPEPRKVEQDGFPCGHERTPENTRTHKRGSSYCRYCRNKKNWMYTRIQRSDPIGIKAQKWRAKDYNQNGYTPEGWSFSAPITSYPDPEAVPKRTFFPRGPRNHKKYDAEGRRKFLKADRDRLSNTYVRAVLRASGWPMEFVNEELVDTKRLLLRLKREIKNGKHNP